MKELPPGYTRLPEEPLPVSTFWPAGLALAITFIFWGLIASWLIFGFGVGLLVASLSGWINEIRHERRH